MANANKYISLAQLLDEVLPMIITEREQGNHPKSIKLHPLVFQEVMRCKVAEVKRNVPILVLGLQIEQSKDTLIDSPEIY